MEVFRVPFHRVPQLSRIDVAYTVCDERLRPFYHYDVSLDQFQEVIAERLKFSTDRKALVAALRQQYADLDTAPQVDRHLSLLEEDRTFTVTTAHQPCLFTGPLYYVYKIFSTIRLADRLSEAYPEYRFVPVFVSGAEDHDFDEVNKAHLFHKTLIWENEESGPTGAMSTATLQPALNALREVLGDAGADVYSLIEKAYTSHANYGRATLHLLHSLFGAYGLVVLDANTPALKRLFIPAMERELVERSSKELVELTQQELEAAGFSPQAHAREINLFYMRGNLRERIVMEDGKYQVLNTGYSFTQEEILEELHRSPEHFSPNVVMRPLYQETLLPNLAYIGGGGEIAYWLERKAQFRHFGVHYPMLVRRNSLWWIDASGAKRLEKLGLRPEELFEDTESLVNHYVTKHTEHEISLSPEKQQLQALYSEILHKAIAIDPTMEKAVLAEQAKQLNGMEHLETKLLRAEKQRQETAVQQIRALKDRYFAGGGLQERRDNFLPVFIKHGNSFFDFLRATLDPLDRHFLIVQE